MADASTGEVLWEDDDWYVCLPTPPARFPPSDRANLAPCNLRGDLLTERDSESSPSPCLADVI